MGFLVVVLLLALWAGILLPGALRAHRSASPLSSVDDFERSMVMLAPARSHPGRQVMVLRQPASVTVRPGRARLMRRRRNTLAGLGAICLVTAVLALAAGGAFWLLFLLAGGSLGAYVNVLVQLRAAQVARHRTVRRLPVQHASQRSHAQPIRRAG
jgi:hypothetical protein